MNFLIPTLTLVIGCYLGVTFFHTPPIENSPPNPPTTLAHLSSHTGQTFPFSNIIEETCDVKVLSPEPHHRPLLRAINKAGLRVSQLMSRSDSPARSKRRINEVSALFEEALRKELNAQTELTCDFPKNHAGKSQRAGYPDLRVLHHPTGAIAYLDPKLFEKKSSQSSFRSFYYEPAGKRTKVTEDALHLLLGFPHDGKTQAWIFSPPRLIDLSDLKVKLKTEFSASNKELYQSSSF